jgi:hypothetical protein
MFKDANKYDQDTRKLPRVFTKEHKANLKAGVQKRKTTLLFEGKNMSEWSKELGIARKRLTKHFKETGTVHGSVDNRIGNKKQVGRKRSQESIDKGIATRKKNNVQYTAEAKKAMSEAAKKRWADPDWVAKHSTKGRVMSDEEKKQRKASALKRWANTTAESRKRANKAIKLFNTPYGVMSLSAAMKISGLTEHQCRGRIGRKTNGWGSTDRYISVPTGKKDAKL